MSYQELQGYELDPLNKGPEQVPARPMDIAKLPYPDPIYIHQVPTGGPDANPNISAQVGGLLGPSDQEKANAVQYLGYMMTAYANSLIMQQYCNREMKRFSDFAVTLGKKATDADVQEVVGKFKEQAIIASARSHDLLPLIDEYSKKDSKVWDDLNAKIQALQKEMAETGSVTPKAPVLDSDGKPAFEIKTERITASPSTGAMAVAKGVVNVRSGPSTNDTVLMKSTNGQQFPLLEKLASGWVKVKTPDGKTGYMSGDYVQLVGGQVGVIVEAVIVVVVIVALSVAAAAVAKLLDSSAKIISAKNSADTQKKTLAMLQVSQVAKANAWEDFKKGVITKEQYDAKIAEENKNQSFIEEIQKSASDQAKKLNIDWKIFAVVAGVGVLGVIAWKKGWIGNTIRALKSGPITSMAKKLT